MCLLVTVGNEKAGGVKRKRKEKKTTIEHADEYLRVETRSAQKRDRCRNSIYDADNLLEIQTISDHIIAPGCDDDDGDDP